MQRDLQLDLFATNAIFIVIVLIVVASVTVTVDVCLIVPDL